MTQSAGASPGSVAVRGVVTKTVTPNLAEASAEHFTLGAPIGIANPVNAQIGNRLLYQPPSGTTVAMEYYFDGSKWWLLYHS